MNVELGRVAHKASSAPKTTAASNPNRVCCPSKLPARRMTWIRNLVVAALVVIVATTAFGYGVGVGYYRWPPFGMLLNIARTVSEPASGSGNSAYYEARAAQHRDLRGSPDIVMLGDSLTERATGTSLFQSIASSIGVFQATRPPAFWTAYKR